MRHRLVGECAAASRSRFFKHASQHQPFVCRLPGGIDESELPLRHFSPVD
jgi:hypothetical protein